MDHETLATLLRIAEAIEARGAERIIDGECTTVYLDALVDASARVREAHRYCAALNSCAYLQIVPRLS